MILLMLINDIFIFCINLNTRNENMSQEYESRNESRNMFCTDIYFEIFKYLMWPDIKSMRSAFRNFPKMKDTEDYIRYGIWCPRIVPPRPEYLIYSSRLSFKYLKSLILGQRILKFYVGTFGINPLSSVDPAIIKAAKSTPLYFCKYMSFSNMGGFGAVYGTDEKGRYIDVHYKFIRDYLSGGAPEDKKIINNRTKQLLDKRQAYARRKLNHMQRYYYR